MKILEKKQVINTVIDLLIAIIAGLVVSVAYYFFYKRFRDKNHFVVQQKVKYRECNPD